MVFIIISMSKGMLKYAIIKEKHKNSDNGCEKRRMLFIKTESKTPSR